MRTRTPSNNCSYCILQQTSKYGYKLLLQYTSKDIAEAYLAKHKLAIHYQVDYSEYGLMQWIVGPNSD